MDHHCPWTANCVSHTTYPHFLRFVFYDVVTLSYNEYLLYLRALEIWHDRTMPSVSLAPVKIWNVGLTCAYAIPFMKSIWDLLSFN